MGLSLQANKNFLKNEMIIDVTVKYMTNVAQSTSFVVMQIKEAKERR